MIALVTEPGQTHTTHIEEVPAVEAREGEVLVRTLEVGVCGTDREISEGLFGVPPEEEPLLVLGHEALAVVERDGYGFTRGQLVTATVRRSCGHCIACAEDSPDSCLSGDYSERGITRLHGYDRELVPEPGQPVDQLGGVRRAAAHDGELHPFTPVSVTPSMKAFWAKKNTMITGAITISVAAMVRFQSVWWADLKVSRP